jgi:hypothetical protein
MAAIVNNIKSTIAENFGGPRYFFFNLLVVLY